MKRVFLGALGRKTSGGSTSSVDDKSSVQKDDQVAVYSNEIEVYPKGTVETQKEEKLAYSGSSKVNHVEEDGDDSGNDDLEDLDAILENMDIDRDFQVFESFKNSMGRRSSITVAAHGRTTGINPLPSVPEVTADEHRLEKEDIEKWEGRIARDEVFSHRYSPSKAEKMELRELEKVLHMDSILGFISPFRDKNAQSPDEIVWKNLVDPDTKTTPASIILKRGPLLCKSSADADQKESEVELIAMTHGCVIASVSRDDSGRAAVKRKFHRALEYKSVVCVMTDPEDDLTWRLVLRTPRGQEQLCFVSGSHRQKTAWLEAMEAVIVNHYLHDKDFPKELGWQYMIIRKPAFTMAVVGAHDDLQIPEGEYVNTLDTYNRYAPLHYAVRMKHEGIIQSLLEAKADPNIKDGDGLTPVYYAVQDEAPESVLQLLERFGAHGIQKVKDERKELMERVIATQQDREERREKEEQKQALAAQAKMAENMRLLNERGEKINEAASRARQLNEGAQDYSDMARQLKEMTKKQASWGF